MLFHILTIIFKRIILDGNNGIHLTHISFRIKGLSFVRLFKKKTALELDLESWQRTIIFRLRTRHCRLLSHMHRLKISPTMECPRGTGIQDPTAHTTRMSYIHHRENTLLANTNEL